MKKDELYKEFSHYEALGKSNSTYMQRLEIYKLMEVAGINVPEPAEERVKKGRFPFNCDFFISKHPTAKIIKWVPTRSPEKQAKFTYKDPKYFLDILSGVSPTTAGASLPIVGVVMDPSNTILEEQAMHVSNVLFKVQAEKLTREQLRDVIVDVLANEKEGLKGYESYSPIIMHVGSAKYSEITIHEGTIKSSLEEAENMVDLRERLPEIFAPEKAEPEVDDDALLPF